MKQSHFNWKKIQINKQEKKERTIWEKNVTEKSFSFDENKWKLKQNIQTKSRWIHCNDFTTWPSFPVICTVIGSLNNTSFLYILIRYRRKKSNKNSFFIKHLHFLRYMQRNKEYIKKKCLKLTRSLWITNPFKYNWFCKRASETKFLGISETVPDSVSGNKRTMRSLVVIH